MASCLKEVLGENQFTFISSKQIANCILIANEVIDDISKRKKEVVLFKADFSRAYDTVDWHFLNLILKKMGFDKRWRKWVHFCISTSSIVVLVNGCPSDSFSIKIGLRQGYPLSLLLFNVVGEVLSGMLKKATEIGLCGGVGVGAQNEFEVSMATSVEKDSLNYRAGKAVADSIDKLIASFVWKDFQNLLITFWFIARVYGRFGNAGAPCGIFVWFFLRMLKICFRFHGKYFSPDQIFYSAMVHIGVWANAFWPSLIPSLCCDSPSTLAIILLVIAGWMSAMKLRLFVWTLRSRSYSGSYVNEHVSWWLQFLFVV
ncbi:hypothetical protein F3Y22_tig00111053pilonHSYRG00091 [Hibiscus syriacus]|uniref:Reverse transcriptase domain-containing protein n=1 Tax=Hibiscus syriacus TaxID=106335 RepID=A0A6A2Z689_HIBSY|nr:hypothetical protein F3Y22_tig00111053pilonHSYRG00091 [Hibiscus syriacus]